MNYSIIIEKDLNSLTETKRFHYDIYDAADEFNKVD